MRYINSIINSLYGQTLTENDIFRMKESFIISAQLNNHRPRQHVRMQEYRLAGKPEPQQDIGESNDGLSMHGIPRSRILEAIQDLHSNNLPSISTKSILKKMDFTDIPPVPSDTSPREWSEDLREGHIHNLKALLYEYDDQGLWDDYPNRFIESRPSLGLNEEDNANSKRHGIISPDSGSGPNNGPGSDASHSGGTSHNPGSNTNNGLSFSILDNLLSSQDTTTYLHSLHTFYVDNGVFLYITILYSFYSYFIKYKEYYYSYVYLYINR